MAHAATDPIPQGDEVVPFLNEWKRKLKGQEILALKERTDFHGEAVCFLPDPNQDEKIVDARDIFNLDTIPSQDAVKKAGEMVQIAHANPLNKNKDLSEGCLLFTSLGQVARRGLFLLQLKHTIINFASNLRSMLEWLDKVAKYDKAWETFRNILCDTTGILTHTFEPHCSVSPDINHLFSFIGERWLTGEAIDATLDMFSVQYSLVEGFVFLPTHIPAQWEQGRYDYVWTFRRDRVRWLMERAQQNLTAKAFTVMNTGDHWAPLCIDFTQKSILFGDSLDDGRPRLGPKRLGHVQRWLSSCDVDVESWNITEDKIQRLDVPLQPRGRSGSCGVIALNSIERGIDPSVERWSHGKSAHHRLRYLALLTRPYKVLPIQDIQGKTFKTSLQTQAIRDKAVTKTFSSQMQDTRDKEVFPLTANSQMDIDQTDSGEEDAAKEHCGQQEQEADQISVRSCNDFLQEPFPRTKT